MRVSTLAITCLCLVGYANTASAVLNEFSIADGYMGAHATRVWTYNPLWHFDGGNINGNYVAQHGYNSGFALNEPYGLVVRNDNAADNYQFSYDVQSVDVAGLNPAAMGSNILVLTFDVCAVTAQNSGQDDNATMFRMDFGGTRANPGMTLGFSDANKLMWSDAAGTLHEYNGYTLNQGGWDRVSLKLDFGNDTYDLVVEQMTGDGINASNTYTPINSFNVVSGQSFTNPLSSLTKLYFETFTDPEDGGGWHKLFLDNFDSMLMIPEPASGLLLVFGSLGLFVVRRRGH